MRSALPKRFPGSTTPAPASGGISYSGGHVLIVSALDTRPAFAISTIPVIDGRQTLRRVHGEARFAKLAQVMAADRRRRFAGGLSELMRMSPTSRTRN